MSIRRGLKSTNLRYSAFVHQIDVDAVFAELGWLPEREARNRDGDLEQVGFCPDLWGMHKNGDTTGKFAYNPEKATYNCWVCGGGTLLSLVMEWKSLDYIDATNWLYQFTKVRATSPKEFYSEVEAILDRPKVLERTLPYFNERVLDRFSDFEHPWFSERNISNDVRAFFKLKFDPASTRSKPPGAEKYTGATIVLPHYWKGRLVGWQQRWLADNRPKWVPKYTNTSDFPREETLWGYDFAIKQTEQPIVVESVPTALFLISEGYPAIATFGGEVTDEQMKLLRVFQQGVIVAPDNDPAGRSWLSYDLERPNHVPLIRYLERFIPVLVAPYVEGSGGDLGDLTPEELPIHLQGTSHPSPM